MYSNPPDPEADPIANDTNMNYLKSQFLLDYFNANRTAGTYDSYSMSVARGQVTAEAITGGVRYRYELGEQEKIEYFVPTFAVAGEVRGELIAAAARSRRGHHPPHVHRRFGTPRACTG